MSLELAGAVLRDLEERGRTLATAESLTGGGLGSLLTSVPGASRVYVGGVITYATRLKVELLQVPLEVVQGDGVVSAACARAMAAGVRTVLGADVGLATTGVAGPDLQEGRPAGTVFVAVADAGGDAVRALRVPGDRVEVRAAATGAALELLRHRMSVIR